MIRHTLAFQLRKNRLLTDSCPRIKILHIQVEHQLTGPSSLRADCFYAVFQILKISCQYLQPGEFTQKL